ncbi:MAG: hypothetical protein XD95_0135 [Microgenomates bacterium 39_7]|nr:MAG: hypothetical protein XD95_0135 [Microgenomates bacterium 39_7]
MFYSYQHLNSQQELITLNQTDQQAQIASTMLPDSQVMGVESHLELEDARAQIVANFLQKYNSPLTPHDYYGAVLVEVADRYNLDFRFLPAIMMEESNLCKNIPEGTYNCLGFGIHSRGTLGFESYEAGFERAARELRANYVEQGRLQVSEIAKKYTASVDKWTDSVNQWMTEMKYDDRAMGLERKADTNVLEYVREGEVN